MPRPSATFSPLTTTRSSLELLAHPRDEALDRLLPRATYDIRDEEDPHPSAATASGRGGIDRDLDVVAALEGECATSDCSTAEVSATVPMRVRPCST